MDLSGKTLETSIRLTVTVYSPSRELTVDRFSTKIGWKLVEKSSVEIAHDREENLIFISVVEAFPRLLVRVSWVQLPERRNIRVSRVYCLG